jgi:hypothetical protein
MSADINGDGRVTSSDAFGILEMAVRMPTATPSAWMFLQEKQDLRAISRTNAQVTVDTSVSLPDEAEVNWVGLLKGDVNGSWGLSNAQKVEQLQPDYFTRLASIVGVPQDQWGSIAQANAFGE